MTLRVGSLDVSLDLNHVREGIVQLNDHMSVGVAILRPPLQLELELSRRGGSVGHVVHAVVPHQRNETTDATIEGLPTEPLPFLPCISQC